MNPPTQGTAHVPRQMKASDPRTPNQRREDAAAAGSTKQREKKAQSHQTLPINYPLSLSLFPVQNFPPHSLSNLSNWPNIITACIYRRWIERDRWPGLAFLFYCAGLRRLMLPLLCRRRRARALSLSPLRCGVQAAKMCTLDSSLLLMLCKLYNLPYPIFRHRVLNID